MWLGNASDKIITNASPSTLKEYVTNWLPKITRLNARLNNMHTHTGEAENEQLSIKYNCFMNAVGDHHVLFVYLSWSLLLISWCYVALRIHVVGVGLIITHQCQSSTRRQRGMALFQVLVALLVSLVSCLCFREGEAAQCMPDSINPCIARCNGTSFDLSKAFDFPWVCLPIETPLSSSVDNHCFAYTLLLAECNCLSLDLALGNSMAMRGVLVSLSLVNQAIIQTQIVLWVDDRLI